MKALEPTRRAGSNLIVRCLSSGLRMKLYVSSSKTSSVGQLTWFVIRKMETLSKKERGSVEPVSRTPSELQMDAQGQG
jgi:hypothetical protein